MNNSLISEITGQNDIDPAETKEWIEALQSVLEQDGSERAHFLIEQLVAATRHSGGGRRRHRATGHGHFEAHGQGGQPADV